MNNGFNDTFVSRGTWTPDGHAEWIYERPTIAGNVNLLANAAPTFTGADALVTGGPWTPVGNLRHSYVTSWTCNDSLELGYPGSISADGSSFSGEYLHSGGADHGDGVQPCKG